LGAIDGESLQEFLVGLVGHEGRGTRMRRGPGRDWRWPLRRDAK
jgi:hypothetical protein